MAERLPDTPPQRSIPEGYRAGIITAITVLLGFSLALFRFWGFEAPGDWTLRSIVAAATTGLEESTDSDERCRLAGMRAELSPRGVRDRLRRYLDHRGQLSPCRHKSLLVQSRGASGNSRACRELHEFLRKSNNRKLEVQSH